MSARAVSIPGMKQVPVLIAGGGPVGMTLGCELSRRGIACLLVERNPTTTRHPKMDITNARSMELFRRLGVVDALRAVAVPETSNFDVSWITHLTGHELHRFRYPSVSDWRRLIRARNDGSMPAEPPMRVSQVEIEPVLQRAVQAAPMVEARWGVELQDLSQDRNEVIATLRTADGTTEKVGCRYLVRLRRGNQPGSRMRRHPARGPVASAAALPDAFPLVRCRPAPALGDRLALPVPCGHPDRAERQRYHGPCRRAGRRRWRRRTVDIPALLRGFAGRDFAHEVLVANAWTPHFRGRRTLPGGRVLLAGDAAHQYVPTGDTA